MADWESSTFSDEKGRYNETCGACGAVFEVVVPGSYGRISREERSEYACPECGNPYHCRSTSPPRVRLLSPRTDR
jgi:predicted RNA-binding Zn-ribbon protein involved in translation (DUF1610 family)